MRILLWTALAVVAAYCAVHTASRALAHSWYDYECCSDRDCFPVAVDDVVESADGSWKHLPTGTVFTKEKVKPSKDGRFHVCISPTTKTPFCIYILQGS